MTFEQVQPVLPTRDVEAPFQEYAGQGVFHEHTALRDTAWATREFAYYDPDMNGLSFYHDLGVDT